MDKRLESILMKVEKPARYIGGEPNSVIKNKEDISVRFAFCFPDIYEIGMSHLGIKILYSLFNEREDIWCERVFAPWVDMQEQMIKNNIPLYALESKDPVSDFDFIGFTLQYELSYTNVLNMLRLSGIPIKSKDRKELFNIVVAGGPCACNPEPLADFIDIFFLGEGEEVDLEVMDLYKQCKKNGETKEEFLRKAAKIEGVYVPSLYDVSYNEDGTICEIKPIGDAPEKIRKRIMKDMDKSYYPKSFVTPLMEIVHDRAVSEVFRGCIRGCRFCQAGFMNRPVREKSVETVNEQCKILCENTGYDEISLSSLSTSDYSKLDELLDTLHTWTEKENISVSLPSLRVDGFSTALTDKIKSVRKGGLTFAPEAGTQRMRDVINKDVTEAQLKKTVSVAFEAGWSKIKLYFMIGLPTETNEDVKGIADLAQMVVDEYYRVNPKGKGAINVGVSAASFVPKPFTPFQWEPQDTMEMLEEKQKVLYTNIKTRKVRLTWHGAKTSFLEAVFARGDRKLCAVLEEALNRGMIFDGWDECFSLEKYLEVFEDLGIDPAFYANRRREFTEVLPWDHLDYGVTKDFLIRECKKAYEAQTTANCKKNCAGCGVNKCYGKVEGGVCP